MKMSARSFSYSRYPSKPKKEFEDTVPFHSGTRIILRHLLLNMASQKKVAVITGGASGMGYAVSKALTERGDWDVHIFDMAKTGNEMVRI